MRSTCADAWRRSFNTSLSSAILEESCRCCDASCSLPCKVASRLHGQHSSKLLQRNARHTMLMQKLHCMAQAAAKTIVQPLNRQLYLVLVLCMTQALP